VRAGLVRDPKEYRHCGYAEALAGNKLARKGLLSFLEEKKWDEAAASYRMRLFVIGSGSKQYGKQELTREEMRAVLAQGGQLSVAEVLRLRVRHMSDGVALGSRAFVEEVFALNKEKFGAKRKSGARPIKALSAIGLASLRDLRVRALS
jgi:putative transposase